jgi:hypothetical protein
MKRRLVTLAAVAAVAAPASPPSCAGGNVSWGVSIGARFGIYAGAPAWGTGIASTVFMRRSMRPRRLLLTAWFIRRLIGTTARTRLTRAGPVYGPPVDTASR